MAQTIYLKMKNASGSSVYRNIIGSASGKKVKLSNDVNSGDALQRTLQTLGQNFLPVQTEAPDLENGKLLMKVVTEEVYTVALAEDALTISGSDSWTDTRDEKLITSLTTGDKTYNLQISNAATSYESSPGGGNILEDRVSRYANNLSSYLVDENGNELTWTVSTITGKKDSIVAQSD